MTANEQQMKHILEILVRGSTCDHQIVSGGILILDSDKGTHEGVDTETFLALQRQDLISEQSRTHNYHPVFRPSFKNPVILYGITEEGREYLERQD